MWIGSLLVWTRGIMVIKITAITAWVFRRLWHWAKRAGPEDLPRRYQGFKVDHGRWTQTEKLDASTTHRPSSSCLRRRHIWPFPLRPCSFPWASQKIVSVLYCPHLYRFHNFWFSTEHMDLAFGCSMDYVSEKILFDLTLYDFCFIIVIMLT